MNVYESGFFAKNSVRRVINRNVPEISCHSVDMALSSGAKMIPQEKGPDHGRHRLAEFGLNPLLIHANHGSYGAVPEPVRTAQRDIQDRLRANPCGFFRSEYPARIRAAASRAAEFLGGAPRDWVFIENATQAANAVISSTELAAGDEVLTTDQIYPAVRNTIRHRCNRAGANLVEAKISLPVAEPNNVVPTILNAVTDKTRLAVLDHISSPCGIVFPITELCAKLREQGVPVFVDAAHAPGNVDVDVSDLDADFYAANAHKWLCAPHGAGMLWCRADRQKTLRPLTVSHGYDLGFTSEFDWPGTRDPSAWLSIPAAIDFHIGAGGPVLRARNREVASTAAQLLAGEFDTVLAAPLDMQCSMATIRLPNSASLQPDRLSMIQQKLQTDQNVVVSITSADGSAWLRLSAAIYNDTDDLIEAGHRVWRTLVEGHHDV